MTMAGAKISIRIDLPNGSRLGPGKIALLDAVRAKQSISAAARDLDMSYRRAWLLIDDLNRAFGASVALKKLRDGLEIGATPRQDNHDSENVATHRIRCAGMMFVHVLGHDAQPLRSPAVS